METPELSKKDKIIQTISPNGYLKHEAAGDIYDVLETIPGKYKRLLEIGTGAGDSSQFFSLVKPDWAIFTIDSYQAASAYVGSYSMGDFEKLVNIWRDKYPNIVPIVTNSFTVPWNVPVDVLYIDGDHTYTAVKSDFDRFSPYAKSLVIFDDYGVGDFGVARVVDDLDRNIWEVSFTGTMALARRKNGDERKTE